MRNVIIGDSNGGQDLLNQSEEIKNRLSQMGIKTCDKDRKSVFQRSATFVKKVKNELGQEIIEEDYLSQQDETRFLKLLEDLISGNQKSIG